MKTILKILLPIAVVVASLGMARYMISLRPPVETRTLPQIVPVVRVVTAQPETVRLRVHTQGTVVPRTETSLSSEIAAKVIWVAPSFSSGGFFEKDDVLVRLDPGDYRLAVIQSRAAVAQAQLRLEQEKAESEVTLREWKSLGEGEPSPLLRREPQLAEAGASIQSARAVLAQSERNLERTEVRAPFAGRVRQKNVDVGRFVAVGTPLATIYSVDVAEIRLPLPDEELAFVDLPLNYRNTTRPRPRPRVTLRALFGGAEFSWSGHIVRTEAEIDPQTRMVYAVAQVEDPYGLGSNPNRPPLAVGLFVDAEIHGRTVTNVFRLPRAALTDDQQVAVIDDDSRIRFRSVEVLRFEGETVLLEKGLVGGERISLTSSTNVIEGMAVRIYDGRDTPIDSARQEESG